MAIWCLKTAEQQFHDAEVGTFWICHVDILLATLFDFRSSFNWRKTFFFRHKNPQNSAILQNFPRLKRYFIASNIARYTMVYCLVCKLFEKCFKIASNFWSEHLELLASYVWSRNDLMRSSINWEGKRGTLSALSLSVRSV